jgi:transcriptional regulator with XRE-family HTH domain
MKVGKQRNRLKVLRAERAVTQMDLALAAGLSRDRYWRIENGYDYPTDRERARLAKALRVTPADLGIPELTARAS